MLAPISRQWLAEHKETQIPDCYPVRIMQFGEGNFLRAFVDWIFKRLNDTELFAGTIAVVQPIEKGMVERLAEQDYVYSLLLRGKSRGKIVDDQCFIDVIRDGVNPYSEWTRFLSIAAQPELRYIVSNTTEAGIVYEEAPFPETACPRSFPAKVAAMLAARHGKFTGDMTKGLTFLPCELIENNGGKLKESILRHLSDWSLHDAAAWVRASCRFCNTLVDRIVAGYPSDAEEIWEGLGCRDGMLVVGECFHLWVIEGDSHLADELPFQRAGLNVVVADNLKPYRDRKVRVLNGAHTANVLGGYLAGVDTVGEMMADRQLGAFLKEMVLEEILPGVTLPDADKTRYAEDVFERFQNPFVRHELLSISLNSVSKWKVRVLPSLKDYRREKGVLPKRLAFSLAALVAFYKGEWRGNVFIGARNGNEYEIRDDKPVLDAFANAWNDHASDHGALSRAILSDSSLWDEDLTLIPELCDAVAASLDAIAVNGVRKAMKAVLG